MIKVQGIAKEFDGITILNDISFNVDAGEKVSLIGPGSSGKSTILKIILGLVRPQQGNILLLDEDIHTLSTQAQCDVLRRVGMAFQQGGLFDFMTVEDNLAFAMTHMTDYSQSKIKERIHELLAGVKLSGAEKKFPFELSGGMQKRVGIARALATSPDLAIFDDPTAGLDPVTSTIILNMINDLGKKNDQTTLLIATSNVEIALRFSDRIVIVHESAVVADGLWRDLLLNGSDWVKHFLSVRLIGLDLEYAKVLDLPQEFVQKYWQ